MANRNLRAYLDRGLSGEWILAKSRALFRKYVLEPSWRASGGRRITVFGQSYCFAPESAVFEYGNIQIPSSPLLNDIVAYADYVQLRAVVRSAQLLEKGAVFFDVGAFHGAYAVVVGKTIQEKKGKVIAVEPDPVQFRIMRENVRLNGLEDTVFCHQAAVADYEGMAYLKSQGSESFLCKTQGTNSTETNVVTLKALFDRHDIKKIDILMIDVEGAELLVLRGLPEDIMRDTTIFCEMHPFAWKSFGYNGRDIAQFLSDRGMRCFDMYLQEHRKFAEELFYIGPTVIFPRKVQRFGTAR